MRKRFTEEQILGILREVEKAPQKEEAFRTHGITEQTYYRWKRKYQGVDVGKVQRLRQLEAENARLKQMVADYAMANQLLKERVEKKLKWD
jgi:putative transposase